MRSEAIVRSRTEKLRFVGYCSTLQRRDASVRCLATKEEPNSLSQSGDEERTWGGKGRGNGEGRTERGGAGSAGRGRGRTGPAGRSKVGGGA